MRQEAERPRQSLFGEEVTRLRRVGRLVRNNVGSLWVGLSKSERHTRTFGVARQTDSEQASGQRRPGRALRCSVADQEWFAAELEQFTRSRRPIEVAEAARWGARVVLVVVVAALLRCGAVAQRAVTVTSTQLCGRGPCGMA